MIPVRRRGAALVVRGALLAALLVPAVAGAHGALKSSTPASGAHLATAPRALRLDFTEVPELAFVRIQLLGPGGESVALGAVQGAPDSRRSVIAPVTGALVAGSYTVVWQMAGADGHPVRGRFGFTIVPGAAGLGAAASGEPGAAVTPPGATPAPAAHHDPTAMPQGGDFDAESPLYVAVRWLQFTALLVVFGAVAFQLLVLGFLRRTQHPDSPMLAAAGGRAAVIGAGSTVVVGLAALLRLVAQSYAMHGAGDAWNGTLVATMLGSTLWGWGWLLQIAGVVMALVGFTLARRGSGAGWALATLGAVVLAFTPAFAGHAAAAPRMTALAIAADGVHVLGAGGWLGSLLVVVAVGIPAALRLPDAERGPAVADLVNAFSPTALMFAGVVSATGVFAAWLHLGSVSALWQTAYGKTLLVKLAILSVVAGTGAYNWLRVKPRLGQIEGARRIRRSATIELAVGILVLGATAVLVATPTAMDIRAMQPTASTAAPH